MSRSRTRLLAAWLGCLLALGLLGFSAPPAAAQPATWSASLANVPNAAPLGNAGSGVTVAVLDTWVDSAHPEFGGRVMSGADCSTGTCVPGSAATSDDGCEPHGTHVAGIVASTDYGVAPAATILPVKVLHETPGGCVASAPAVAQGIEYAIGQGARVINVSLGADGQTAAAAASTELVTASDDAANAGDLVIFAAGNSGPSQSAAQFPHALTVGAVGPTGALASYSASGATLLGAGGQAAPGGDCSVDSRASADCVISTWYCATPQSGCDPHGLAYDQGTSMAAPQVAGLAALLYAQAPGRGLANVVTTLENTASKGASGDASAYGLIDACAAMLVAAPAGSSCGSGALAEAKGDATHPVTRTFVGCPHRVTVVRGRHPVVRCRITPRQGNVVIYVQVPRGHRWITVGRVRTARDGSFRVVAPVARANTALKFLVASGRSAAAAQLTIRIRR